MKRTSKLSINRQTVRLLDENLASVAGGDTTRFPTWREGCTGSGHVDCVNTRRRFCQLPESDIC